MRSVEIVTAGMLPVRLRIAYGFGWGPARALVVAGAREWTRRLAMPLVPDLVRAATIARRAEGRAGLGLERMLPSTRG